MTPRVPVIAVRLLVLVAVWLLGTSTLSLAQESAEEPPVTVEPTDAATTSGEAGDGALVVPEVRGLPYVFAKGVLEDAGFGWKVVGKVKGYAVNVVTDQSVEPGTEVLDTGAPLIELRLEESAAYEPRGLPDNASPYKPTELVVAGEGVTLDDLEPSDDPGADESPDGSEPGVDPESAEPADPPIEPTASEPAPAETVDPEPAAATTGAAREPDFVVEGAPAEPVDEMPLPDRARKLLAWAEKVGEPTPETLDHYSYQHAWIVSGARFGWWHGAEALEILLEVDQLMQKRFDLGKDAEKVTRAALAEVRAASQS